jgi:hypothetical protein
MSLPSKFSFDMDILSFFCFDSIAKHLAIFNYLVTLELFLAAYNGRTLLAIPLPMLA